MSRAPDRTGPGNDSGTASTTSTIHKGLRTRPVLRGTAGDTLDPSRGGSAPWAGNQKNDTGALCTGLDVPAISKIAGPL